MRLTLLILLSIVLPALGATRYVDPAATGLNDGSSWANAWTNILWLDRFSNKVSYGDTVRIAGAVYPNTTTSTNWMLPLKEGNVSGGVTNWTRYYFDGPAQVYCGFKVYNYTELNGGINQDYATNLVTTYDTALITNNINLWIRRETNFFCGSVRSILISSHPAIVKWIHITGATNILDNTTPPFYTKSSSAYEITGPNATKPVEVGYIWCDKSSGHGAAGTFGFSGNGCSERPLGTINIHHCLIENHESDICNVIGGVDFHHNFIRHRNKLTVGGCNDTFTLSGNECNMRIYNNIIEPDQNTLYYLWGCTTNIHDFYFYGNLLTPVPLEYRRVPDSGSGSGIMEQDIIQSGMNMYYMRSNIVFANNTWVGTGPNEGGCDRMISFITKDTLVGSFTIDPWAFIIKNNLFAHTSTEAMSPAVLLPMKFYPGNAHNQAGTNNLGYGWYYGADSIVVDYNLFDMYFGGNLTRAMEYGQTGDAHLYLTNATDIADALGYVNNVSLTNAVFVDAPNYDFRPASSVVNIGEDLSSWLTTMVDLDKDIYGNTRTNWSVGAVEYTTLSPEAPSILSNPTSVTNIVGANASFTVNVSGSSPLVYSWFQSFGSTTNLLPSQTSHICALLNIQSTNAGTYWSVITNAYGGITSQVATLTVTNAPSGGITNTNGLLCWLRFDDDFTGNGFAEDSSGNEAHMLRYGFGSSLSNYPAVSTGKRGSQSASFVPYYDWHPYSDPSFVVGQFGAITNLGGMTTLTQATFAMWYKTIPIDPADRGLQHNAHLLDAGYGALGNWNIGRYYSSTYGAFSMTVITNTGGITAAWYNWFPNVATYYWFTNSTWWHLAASVDCTVPTNLVCTLYTNGVQYAYNTITLDPTNAVPYLTPWTTSGFGKWIAVGCWSHNGTPRLDDADELPNNGWLQGYLDSIRIYDRILSSAEIRTLAGGVPPIKTRHNQGFQPFQP